MEPATRSIPSPTGPAAGRHAVVIGASMSGLVAARVAADHFERVTIVERDELPHGPDARKGVPQGRHLHGLLRRGEDILSSLFPDLVPALRAGGAELVHFGRDFAWHHFGAWKAPCPDGVRMLCLTRPYLEHEVRRRVLGLPNVCLLDGAAAEALLTDADRRQVRGVSVQRRPGGTERLEADLVIDAAGRGSPSPRWLEGIGRARPPESVIKVNVGYASRLYRRPPSGTWPWKCLYVLGAPPSRRLGAIFPVEGDRWIVVLAGLLDDHPPADEAGYLAFARSLPVPDVYDALRDAAPLTDAATYRFSAHQRRHYERVRDFPDGLVVLGDSSCSFNPVYGQGITTAALGAIALGEELAAQRARRGAGDLAGLSPRFQRRLAKIIDDPWAMSTGEDLRYPEVAGPRTALTRAMQWYTARVHRAATRDPVVAAGFYRAMHMIDPPTALMRPGVALRVLRRGGELAGAAAGRVVVAGEVDRAGAA